MVWIEKRLAHLPYAQPLEYDLTIVAEKNGIALFHIGLVAAGTPFSVLLDRQGNIASCIGLFGTGVAEEPSTFFRGRRSEASPGGVRRRRRMDEALRTRWNADAWRVTLDRAVGLPRGSLIASLRRMGNGFLVQGCDFGYNRSRGILIKASDGKVTGNKLRENWGRGIIISIVGNTISDSPLPCIEMKRRGYNQW